MTDEKDKTNEADQQGRQKSGAPVPADPFPVTLARLEGELPPARDPTLISEDAGGKETLPAPPLRDPPTAGHVLGGRYELQELVAAGGMGKIYRGRHMELRTPIAVKIMHSHVAESAEHIERFRREARAASRLNHPNVVRVLDFGEVADTFYIVMEYIEGINLASWLEKHTFPPLLEHVLPLSLQILDALSRAHELGIVHRDLKPENVLLTTDVTRGLWCKLVDFGLARFQESTEHDRTLTRADAVAGTPGYMSPEQCRSLKVTASTDLYAFGCLLTEMLQLAPVFTGDSVMDVISKHMFAPVPPLARPQNAEPVPPLLERLRLDLLAKMPTQRPASASIARQRMLEAFNPQATTAAFPARKNMEVMGARSERIPTWNRDSVVPNGLPAVVMLRVASTRASPTAAALDEQCLLGLASQGLQLSDISAWTAAPELLVSDIGVPTQDALLQLRELRARWPETKILVCADQLTAARLNQLIEAGADDVVRYPVAADVLGRKLTRLSPLPKK